MLLKKSLPGKNSFLRYRQNSTFGPAQELKMLAVKADDPSSISGAHIVEGEMILIIGLQTFTGTQ